MNIGDEETIETLLYLLKIGLSRKKWSIFRWIFGIKFPQVRWI